MSAKQAIPPDELPGERDKDSSDLEDDISVEDNLKQIPHKKNRALLLRHKTRKRKTVVSSDSEDSDGFDPVSRAAVATASPSYDRKDNNLTGPHKKARTTSTNSGQGGSESSVGEKLPQDNTPSQETDEKLQQQEDGDVIGSEIGKFTIKP